MSALKLINPAFWYLTLVKAGVKVVLVAALVLAGLYVAADAGLLDGMLRSLVGI